ncbi:MAG: VaFE repeat-containing surface-anchored protein, partial [Atopobiaceae bacterium]|nr:VaFE repeat-containing surface-anchored protein [Atopobiaceae bacterium]
LWFSGGTDRDVAVRDDLGALPYDRYRVTELRCASNEGLELVSFDVRISRDLYVVDGGTVDDSALPVIQTALATVSVSDDGTWLLQDSVWYGNLTADGSQYELRGSLHLVGEDGSDAGVLTDSEGNEVTALTAFTPLASSGMEMVSFKLDARELKGHTIVAFEELWKDGKLIAEHADITDEDQTAQVPGIGTTLADEAGSKEVDGTAQVRLVDEVTYEGLVPQKVYQIVGTLMDKETGETLCGRAGAPITAQTTFVPSESSGTAQVTFTFDGAPHRGKSIVAFESLRQNDLELAVHADITDEAQTVTIPSIGTTAADVVDADHTLLAEEDARLVDHVSYHGLIPGAEYVLTGHLVDRETGESLADGVVSTSSELAFVPESSDGSIDIELSLNARALAGREVTVYERLQRDGSDVASHEDLSSDDQSLSIPAIGTTATSTEGSKRIAATKDQAIIDTVSYQGLTPGREYLVTGTIHKRGTNGTDAGALKNARGKEVTASVTFTPETSSGSVKVSFLIDATSLDDTTLVAFEQLIDVGTGALVATHEDISDEEQSVNVTKAPEEAKKAEKADSPARKLPQTGEELIPYGIMLGGAGIAIALGTIVRKHDD